MDIGKSLVVFGVVITLVGVFFIFGEKIPFLGKLPGDIYIKRDGFTFYFPLVTCIIVSIIITVLLRLFQK